ncbi:MAG: TetR/AcrR family transcriptional regulator [Alphaproteobacteria bacterium]|nr:TetR/AcrR family transcriptional regulator [Alphaproteobacteria bacterium]
MPKSRSAAQRADGRRRRSELSRQQIVRALLELIAAGEVYPSAEAVAANAGVGLRTVFRHFENMETLYRQIYQAITSEVLPVAQEPFESSDWRQCVREIIDRRVRIFERIMPFKAAADVHRHQSVYLAEQGEVVTRLQRGALSQILPREVKSDESLFNALELLLSFESWRRLRKDQHLSVQKARAVIERTISALIGPRTHARSGSGSET